MYFFVLLALFSLQIQTAAAVVYNGDSEYQYMDEIALKTRTDKSSISHNYTRIYSQYFSKYKNAPIKFLEIGIREGWSVRLWEDYFTNADLHFIDNDLSQVTYHSTRSTYHEADQANRKDLAAFAKETGGHFDIILDDGGHHSFQVITSFQELFPLLNSGGMYIIEDLHASYWSWTGGAGSPQAPKASPDSSTEFLKNLVDDLNFAGARMMCADPDKVPGSIRASFSQYQKEIESIHFYTSVCIVIKK